MLLAAPTPVDRSDEFRMVVGLDFSEFGDDALAEALEQATHRGETEIHAVTVVDDGGGGLGSAHDALVAEAAFAARERLVEHIDAGAVSFAESHGVPKHGRLVPHVRVGAPADEIVRLAEDVDADLVVVGTHGRRGIRRWIVGSVAERVIRLAHCPVLVARPKDRDTRPEAPCPACVARRVETDGHEAWCAAHARPRHPPHALSYASLFRPPTVLWFGGDA